MFKIHFEAGDNKQFQILHDSLRVALKPTSFDDCDLVLSIKNKIKTISDDNPQKSGYLCRSCGTLNQAGESQPNRILRSQGGDLVLDRIELNKIKEALDQVVKPYDVIDDYMELYMKFKNAKEETANAN